MSESSKQALTEQHDELLDAMERKRQEWAADGEDKDDTDKLLDEAIAMAVAQGKGWAPGEKEEYISKILDDDYIPPIFAETQEELEQSGLAEAFRHSSTTIRLPLSCLISKRREPTPL